MESKNILYKPKDLYERQLKQQYHSAAAQYFDKLVKETNTDAALNAQHVKEYNNALAKQKAAENEVSKSNGYKALIIFLCVLCFLVGFIFFFIAISNISTRWYFLLITAALDGVGIYLIVYTCKNLNTQISKKQNALHTAEESTKSKLSECYNDMAVLNRCFDWSMPTAIMKKVTDIIDLDPYFSRERLDYLVKKFGLPSDGEDNESTLEILSGNIQGNPFVLKTTRTAQMGYQRYSGTLTITWQTYSINSEGKTVTHHHTQVLSAYTSHPAPIYSTNTVLIYGNEAAPNLTFTHEPSDINQLRQRERESTIKREMKQIRKKADNAVQNGSRFTPTSNDAFDVFFGGLDRNNEVEFRLLFTPLAQQNMMSLLQDPLPFGDDFRMIKDHMVNYIISNHSQAFDYSASPNRYQSHNLNESRNAFINYCDEFIENLFFDLAPLLSIPLYQMHKPKEYIYQRDPPSNYSYCEHETIANSMNKNLFRPHGADPTLPVMIKSKYASKNGKVDDVHVHTYSYRTTEMVDYVSVYGNDGYYHDVPVPWIKYDRVDKDTSFDLAYTGASRKQFNNKLSENDKFRNLVTNSEGLFLGRGMISLLGHNHSQKNIEQILKDAFEEKNQHEQKKNPYNK